MSSAISYLPPRNAFTELRLLNARFIENFVRNDVSSHDAMLHAEFIAIQGDGSRIDRAAYLGKWASGFDPEIIVYWDVRDEHITVIGNTALVRATNKEICRRGWQDIAGMSTYTDTYLYEGGAWKCIQAQITPVAPNREPGDDTVIAVYINGVRQ